ncbi:hypothetical protein ASG25_13285 [Rhizobium sp. Leaf384]|uniref:hypothetical protein n=1 Tax=Rhizobium sp. Leaf384 TaxID=1736358 RepID=UPI0007162804|nr:hypothetical protein [Rhizobium sp. Leaf384]KQS79482.1 hypothetical protein ASG25_13285 [Rhizobium sp. Leaf384]
MQSLSNFLTALASLAWPAVAFYAFYVLQDDIKTLIGRLRKGRLFGQEIELGDELMQLESRVESVIDSVPGVAVLESESALSYRDRILAEAERSALGAFLRVSSDLELMVNQVLARTGWHGGRTKYSVREGFARIPQNLTGRELLKTVEQFSHLRNRIIHESRLVSEEDVKRAVEIALLLVEALRSYPIEENRVKDLVDLYADDHENSLITFGLRGIRLETRHGDLPLQIRIYPTTKTWYEPGQLVSWDWDTKSVYGEIFYRDPIEGILKLAFNSSAEFIGQPLVDLN